MTICSRTGTHVDKTNDTECLSELPVTEITIAGKVEPSTLWVTKWRQYCYEKKVEIIEFL